MGGAADSGTVGGTGPESDVLLHIRGLSKRYGGIQALADVDLDVVSGSVHCIVGPNGSGKSTLVKSISGHVHPDSGSMTFGGEPLSLSEPAGASAVGIAVVAQEIAVAPEMSVVENIALGKELKRGPFVNRAETRDAAERALRQISDTIPIEVPAGSLRPSEQRIVMIAAALFGRARLLIMDEPTAGMGLREAEDVLATVERLRSQSLTVIYVSHRLDEVLRVCDVVSIMRDGVHVEDLRGEAVSHGALVDAISMHKDAPPPRARAEARTKPATDATPLVRCEGLTGEFLDDADFSAYAGEVVGVIGTLESGANELLEVLAGVSPPAAGTVEIDGRAQRLSTPIHALRNGIGYLAGGRVTSAIRDLPIRENISLSRPRRVTSAGILTKRHERQGTRPYAGRFGLADRVDEDLFTLSGGNQQKALLSRLLFADVRIVILEDPTLGVDVAARLELLDALVELAEEGRVVILYTSEPAELIGHADRICVLRGGKVVSQLRDDQLTESTIAREMAGFA